MRVTRAGAAGGAAYLVLSALWLVAGRPPGGRLLYELWFIPLLLVGLGLPGAANQVTLARAYLALPAFVYGLHPSSYGLLAVCVALAGATDLVDGTVARRFGASQLGGGLDPAVDGIFFGAVAVGLAAGGAYPWWLAAVVVGRYLLPAVGGAVLLLAGRRPDLRHTLLGQVSTVLIAALLGLVALLRALGQDAAFMVAVAAVVIPVATLATFANLAWEARTAPVVGGRGLGDRPGGRGLEDSRRGRGFGDPADGRGFGEPPDGRGFGDRPDGRGFGDPADGRGFGDRPDG